MCTIFSAQVGSGAVSAAGGRGAYCVLQWGVWSRMPPKDKTAKDWVPVVVSTQVTVSGGYLKKAHAVEVKQRMVNNEIVSFVQVSKQTDWLCQMVTGNRSRRPLARTRVLEMLKGRCSLSMTANQDIAKDASASPAVAGSAKKADPMANLGYSDDEEVMDKDSHRGSDGEEPETQCTPVKKRQRRQRRRSCQQSYSDGKVIGVIVPEQCPEALPPCTNAGERHILLLGMAFV